MRNLRIVCFFALAFFDVNQTAHSVESLTNVQAGYHGGFYLKTEDEKFMLKIGSRIDFGYGYGFLDGRSDLSSFDLLRAKLYLGGNAFSKDIQYFLQAAAGAQSRPPSFGMPSESSTGSFILEDFYLRLSRDDFNAKLGQFKVPFGRQWTIYSGNLQFVDRSNVSKYFLLGRDRGVTFNNEKDTFAATLGVFNGGGTPSQNGGYQPAVFFSNGQNASNDPTPGNGHLYMVRLAAKPYGTTGYSEGDVEMSEGHRIEFGASFAYDQDRDVDLNGDTVLDDDRADAFHVQSEFNWKSLGRSLSGEFFYRILHSDAVGDQDAYGFYIQAGYMLIPSKTELAARFGWLDPNRDVARDLNLEAAGVLNLYLSADHRYKIQTQYTWRSTEQPVGAKINDHFIDMLFQITI